MLKVMLPLVTGTPVPCCFTVAVTVSVALSPIKLGVMLMAALVTVSNVAGVSRSSSCSSRSRIAVSHFLLVLRSHPSRVMMQYSFQEAIFRESSTLLEAVKRPKRNDWPTQSFAHRPRVRLWQNHHATKC